MTGGIPPELGDLAYLVNLWLDGNGLTGGIPPELGLTNLGNLRLAGNELSGCLPRALADKQRLGIDAADFPPC